MKMLFYGGKILTMDIPLYTDAVLVEDGKITAVGRREELTKQAPDTVIDLDGKNHAARVYRRAQSFFSNGCLAFAGFTAWSQVCKRHADTN